MKKVVIDRIIYPVQTKRGLKFPKKKPLQGDTQHIPKDLMQGS